MIPLTSHRLAAAKAVFIVFGPCALLVGLTMLLFPSSFWLWIGIEAGNGIIATLYGSVLVGVGLVSVAGIFQPERHLSLLLLIGSYKLIASMMLLLRCAQLLASSSAPLAGWVIAAIYFIMAAFCLGLYFLPPAKKDAHHV